MKAIVITRDRLSYADQCANWLFDAGLDVTIVDHGSSYPPMLKWLNELSHLGQVHWFPTRHPRALWPDTIRRFVNPDERYIVTDCDIAPHPDYPIDSWLPELEPILEAQPGLAKAGPGLAIHDLPYYYPHAGRVIAWEQQWRDQPVTSGFLAPIDTTFAMYQPLDRCPEFKLAPAIRLPSLVRHLGWHEDPDNLPDDITWYREHLEPGVSHWADPDRYEGRR